MMMLPIYGTRDKLSKRLTTISWLLILFLFLSVVSRCAAQLNPEYLDVRPFAPTSGGSFDSVSLANGSLSLNIPVWSIPQRGRVSLDFFLRYDSPTYHLNYTCYATGAGSSSQQSGPQSGSDSSKTSDSTSDSTGGQPSIQAPPGSCTYPNCPSNSTLVVCSMLWELGYPDDDPELLGYAFGSDMGVRLAASTDFYVLPVRRMQTAGTGTPVVSEYYWQLTTPEGGGHRFAATADTNTFRASDGSGWMYLVDRCTAIDKAGTKLVFTCAPVAYGATSFPHVPGQLLYTEDSNGNRISLNYDSSGSFTGWTDSTGKTVPSFRSAPAAACSSSETGGVSWSVPNATVPITLCFASVAVQTHLEYPNAPADTIHKNYHQYSGTFDTISSVVVPSGDRWQFAYVPQAQDPDQATTYRHGELTKIVMPTGGAIVYQWYQDTRLCGVSPSGSLARSSVYERILYDNDPSAGNNTSSRTWFYAVAPRGYGPQAATSSVTDPLGNVTKHSLLTIDCQNYDQDVVETDSSGNVYRTVHTDYQVLPTPSRFSSGKDPIGAAVLPSKNGNNVGELEEQSHYLHL